MAIIILKDSMANKHSIITLQNIGYLRCSAKSKTYCYQRVVLSSLVGKRVGSYTCKFA